MNQFALWHEMCKNEQISPDIVTLTEVIATLDSASGKGNRQRADEVFLDAVNQRLILRQDSLDTSWEFDLSYMSLPIARAASRYIFGQISERCSSDTGDKGGGDEVKDLSLITGTSRMREHIREVLRDELKPAVHCIVPQREQGTLIAKKKIVQNYVSGQ